LNKTTLNVLNIKNRAKNPDITKYDKLTSFKYITYRIIQIDIRWKNKKKE
jgi:hypothetical protein